MVRFRPFVGRSWIACSDTVARAADRQFLVEYGRRNRSKRRRDRGRQGRDQERFEGLPKLKEEDKTESETSDRPRPRPYPRWSAVDSVVC